MLSGAEDSKVLGNLRNASRRLGEIVGSPDRPSITTRTHHHRTGAFFPPPPRYSFSSNTSPNLPTIDSDELLSAHIDSTHPIFLRFSIDGQVRRGRPAPKTRPLHMQQTSLGVTPSPTSSSCTASASPFGYDFGAAPDGMGVFQMARDIWEGVVDTFTAGSDHGIRTRWRLLAHEAMARRPCESVPQCHARVV